MPTIFFSEENDTYTVNSPDSFALIFLGGDDTLTVYDGTVDAAMGEGNDVAVLRGGTSTVYGESGIDRFELYVGATVHGGGDADRFNIRGGTGLNADGGIGNDRFSFVAAAGNVLIHGGEGHDAIFGNSQSVTGSIHGDSGNDRFLSISGTATIYGGTGNDLFRADPSASVAFVELAGEGYDTVQVSRGHSYTLAANIERLTVGAFSGSTVGPATLTGNILNNLIIGHDNAETIRGAAGNDVLHGRNGNDTLGGGDGNDRLYGGSGNDDLRGSAGADILHGGTGDDLMYGGHGNDVYYIDSLSDQAIENADEGLDTVRASISGYALPNNVENGILLAAGELSGNALDNRLTGTGSSGDSLYGYGGNDTLIGGAGLDAMYGGTGDDTYYVDDDWESVTELLDEGIDTVYVLPAPSLDGYSTYALPANVENGTLLYWGDRPLTLVYLFGNELDNVLIGTSLGGERLTGYGGDDTLHGGDGHDFLWGDDGNDRLYAGDGGGGMYGGHGNDALVGGAGEDYLHGEPGADMLTGGAGNDIFYFDDSYGMDSTPMGHDVITDFTSLNGEGSDDQLDLTGIDADAGVDGDQAFTLNHSGAAVGAAGDLWYQITTDSDGTVNVMFFGDTNGDSAADFQLLVQTTGTSFNFDDLGL